MSRQHPKALTASEAYRKLVALHDHDGWTCVAKISYQHHDPDFGDLQEGYVLDSDDQPEVARLYRKDDQYVTVAVGKDNDKARNKGNVAYPLQKIKAAIEAEIAQRHLDNVRQCYVVAQSNSNYGMARRHFTYVVIVNGSAHFTDSVKNRGYSLDDMKTALGLRMVNETYRDWQKTGILSREVTQCGYYALREHCKVIGVNADNFGDDRIVTNKHPFVADVLTLSREAAGAAPVHGNGAAAAGDDDGDDWGMDDGRQPRPATVGEIFLDGEDFDDDDIIVVDNDSPATTASSLSDDLSSDASGSGNGDPDPDSNDEVVAVGGGPDAAALVVAPAVVDVDQCTPAAIALAMLLTPQGIPIKDKYEIPTGYLKDAQTTLAALGNSANEHVWKLLDFSVKSEVIQTAVDVSEKDQPVRSYAHILKVSGLQPSNNRANVDRWIKQHFGDLLSNNPDYFSRLAHSPRIFCCAPRQPKGVKQMLASINAQGDDAQKHLSLRLIARQRLAKPGTFRKSATTALYEAIASISDNANEDAVIAAVRKYKEKPMHQGSASLTA